jgi:16S rRNA (cytosine967-C5)-methyltransferase
MLAAAAGCLRPKGRLLYITCTTEPPENEDVIEAFLSAHPEFKLATAPEPLPPAARPLIQAPGFFRTSPAEHNLDAFFAAVLVKD